MDTMFCLLDTAGSMHVKDGAASYSEVAAADGLNEKTCEQYRFDLVNRQLLADRGTPPGDRTARAFFERSVGTPERLTRFAADGHLTKDTMAHLIVPEKRREYIEACSVMEMAYTRACKASGDPCLESGCSIDHEHGETCLQPILNAGVEYHQKCAAEWARFFADPRNRIDAWKN
jgi:hypothetical protein